MRIGVISDTHGLLDSRVAPYSPQLTPLMHAGGMGKPELIDALRTIAPVYAVEGNNDSFGEFPIERVEIFDGRTVLICHISWELHQLDEPKKKMIEKTRADVVAFGHSHRHLAKWWAAPACSTLAAPAPGASLCCVRSAFY